ncbi:carbamoyltransferase family protein [Methyloversatilis thermotolerans]|uniref:carbamoyltransferase family protein n=1 Tax=Methyloversatilis thermotolerans TaxID=1346290 RepID=UPI00036D298F|nr:carbamoyltransferase [Methyloversatilis thermotolerans]
MRVLGISYGQHDAAASLVVDGDIVAAAQEERFTRRRHDAGFPVHAIRFCMEQAGASPGDVDIVAFHERPLHRFGRQLVHGLSAAMRGRLSAARELPPRLLQSLTRRRSLLAELRSHWPEVDWAARLRLCSHQLSHAAAAFYPSPFDEAAVLVVDGAGEWATTSTGHGCGRDLHLTARQYHPHSLGLLYSALTRHAGFRPDSGEYKVMGLAPYGEPRYARALLDHLVDVREDGSFRLDMGHFVEHGDHLLTNERCHGLFDGPPRSPEGPLTQRDMDLAASLQAVTEYIVMRLAGHARRTTGLPALCLGGAVALNCVVNGRLLRSGVFERIWVPPAPGEAGSAIGAALAVTHLDFRGPRVVQPDDGMQASLLGPAFEQGDIERRLRAAGAVFEALPQDDMIERTARALADGMAVGWHQGRMEFGPRALGNRSILADPRSPHMQRQLNLKVKFRESFRPFAPSVLREDVSDWFEFDEDSPYMLLVADVAEAHRRPLGQAQRALSGLDRLHLARSDIPAVTHVDNSARIQTVDASRHPLYHRLIARFKAITGCPVLVNTSFNVRGEPVVNTPEDAFRCFMGSGLDLLVVGNCVMEKGRQDPALAVDYRADCAPD